MKTPDLQVKFLNRITESLSDNISFVDELAEVLKISNDSAYRRIRGETALDITEVSTLCSKYNISFDMFYQHTENISFKYNLLQDIETFKNFLKSILKDMQQIESAKDNQIIYAAVDIPIFHHFNYAELSAFKLFYWMKAVVGVKEFENKTFSTKLINEEILEISKAIYKTYLNIPSIEIWTTETVNSLIKQIEFFWESGNFESKDDAIIVCQQVKEEFLLLEKQAENNNKNESNQENKKGEFILYYSDIEIGNNCIYTKRHDLKSVYLSVHTFNKLITTDQIFIKQTESWLDNLISKSTLISGVSQKNRYQFFRNAKEKINSLISRIDNY